MRKKKKSVKSAINQALTCKMAKNSLRKTANRCCYYCYNIVIVLVLIVSNFQIQCGPSAQQEQELLLLDALSRKQSLNSNLNAISTSNNNNYETNTIMDMLGRSMLLKNDNFIAVCHELWQCENFAKKICSKFSARKHTSACH